MFGSGFIRIISNKEMNDIIKIVSRRFWVINKNILVKQFKMKQKNKKEGF